MKLWTIGDSLTEGFDSTDAWANEYVKWKGYVPDCYGDIISKKLGIELKNIGKGGIDNYTIFENFYTNYSNFQEGDIIIIGWTDTGRFRLSSDLDRWYYYMSNYIFKNDMMKNISKSTIDEILVNRMGKIYIDELNNLIEFISKITKHFKVINWTNYNNGLVNALYFDNIHKVFTETNGIIKDYHYSEKGQMEIADILLEAIKNGVKGKSII